jgi:hypothetical protein
MVSSHTIAVIAVQWLREDWVVKTFTTTIRLNVTIVRVDYTVFLVKTSVVT